MGVDPQAKRDGDLGAGRDEVDYLGFGVELARFSS